MYRCVSGKLNGCKGQTYTPLVKGVKGRCYEDPGCVCQWRVSLYGSQSRLFAPLLTCPSPALYIHTGAASRQIRAFTIKQNVSKGNLMHSREVGKTSVWMGVIFCIFIVVDALLNLYPYPSLHRYCYRQPSPTTHPVIQPCTPSSHPLTRPPSLYVYGYDYTL